LSDDGLVLVEYDHVLLGEEFGIGLNGLDFNISSARSSAIIYFYGALALIFPPPVGAVGARSMATASSILHRKLGLCAGEIRV
jgi:hypothetical protein